jgi:hypothetical protein
VRRLSSTGVAHTGRARAMGMAFAPLVMSWDRLGRCSNCNICNHRLGPLFRVEKSVTPPLGEAHAPIV